MQYDDHGPALGAALSAPLGITIQGLLISKGDFE